MDRALKFLASVDDFFCKVLKILQYDILYKVSSKKIAINIILIVLKKIFLWKYFTLVFCYKNNNRYKRVKELRK